MGIRPTLVCAVSASIALWSTLPCSAGEKEQVELLERICTQFESMSAAAGELTALLEKAQDPQSADAILEELAPACDELIGNVESTSSLMKNGMRTASGIIFTPEYKSRADAVAQRQPGLVVEWQRQADRCGKELARIRLIPGLSDRFQGGFQKQAVKLRTSMMKVATGVGGVPAMPSAPVVGPRTPRPGFPEVPTNLDGGTPFGALIPHLTYDQMAAQFGKGRVVRIEITNIKEFGENTDDIQSAIFFAATRRDAPPLATPGENTLAMFDFLNGKVWLGPIDDFDAFCKRIDYG